MHGSVCEANIVQCTNIVSRMYFCAMDTRERILQEALKEFNSAGVANVGVREIARNLGISPGNMSYHFARKEDILRALIDRMSKENDAIRMRFADEVNSLDHFLRMFNELFVNQWRYRGLLSDIVQISGLLSQYSGIDYASAHVRRVKWLRDYLQAIPEDQLPKEGLDIEALSDIISHLARYWIADAFLLSPGIGSESACTRQMARIRALLLPFCTEKGRALIGSEQRF